MFQSFFTDVCHNLPFIILLQLLFIFPPKMNVEREEVDVPSKARQNTYFRGSKMISRNSDKFRETTEGSFEKFIGVSRNHFGSNGNRFLPRQKFLRHFFLFFEYSSFIISKNKGPFFYYTYYFQSY